MPALEDILFSTRLELRGDVLDLVLYARLPLPRQPNPRSTATFSLDSADISGLTTPSGGPEPSRCKEKPHRRLRNRPFSWDAVAIALAIGSLARLSSISSGNPPPPSQLTAPAHLGAGRRGRLHRSEEGGRAMNTLTLSQHQIIKLLILLLLALLLLIFTPSLSAYF